MSLATRCIHCGTIFKIVEDQLKVSEGWVRCGRCQEVFNALPTLFDMESEAPPPRRTPPPQPAPVHEPVTTVPVFAPTATPSQTRLTEDAMPPEPPRPVRSATDFELDTRLPAEEMNLARRAPPTPPPTAPAPAVPTFTEPPRRSTSAASPLAPPPVPVDDLPSTDEADALDSRYLMPSHRERPAQHRRTRGPEFADAEFPTDAWRDADADVSSVPVAEDRHAPRFTAASVEPEALLRNSTAPTPSPAATAAPCTAPAKPAAPTKRTASSKKTLVAAPTPDFIRRAQRQAFWRRPSVRGVLTGLTLALMISLGVQVAHQFRDALAAQYPVLRPALTQWCEMVQCTLQPPLRIDDLQVDSATLLRASSAGPHHYRLTVVVHNRANIAVAWPHVDLTLTDISGAVVARRSFAPADAQWHDGSEVQKQFAPRPVAVPPQSSTTLVWQLRAPTLQPAGYTAELFYP
jgi:predicted Zn finger-like uncharacterized protein